MMFPDIYTGFYELRFLSNMTKEIEEAGEERITVTTIKAIKVTTNLFLGYATTLRVNING